MEEYAIACCKYNQLSAQYSQNICKSFEHTNIKKGTLHMKQRQNKLKKEYIRLNSPTGKKKIIIKNEKKMTR